MYPFICYYGCIFLIRWCYLGFPFLPVLQSLWNAWEFYKGHSSKVSFLKSFLTIISMSHKSSHRYVQMYDEQEFVSKQRNEQFLQSNYGWIKEMVFPMQGHFDIPIWISRDKNINQSLNLNISWKTGRETWTSVGKQAEKLRTLDPISTTMSVE